jgi:hypothetical protein
VRQCDAPGGSDIHTLGGMVATDWGPLIQTGIGAVAALGGGALGTWMQGRSQERLEGARRRERFAEALADTTSLLHEVNPRRPHFGSRLSDASSYHRETDRRLRSVRSRLLILSVGHPDAHVRDLAGRLDKALYELDSAMGIFVDMMETEQRPSTVAKGRADARDRHGEADRLLTDLLKAI